MILAIQQIVYYSKLIFRLLFKILLMKIGRWYLWLDKIWKFYLTHFHFILILYINNVCYRNLFLNACFKKFGYCFTKKSFSFFFPEIRSSFEIWPKCSFSFFTSREILKRDFAHSWNVKWICILKLLILNLHLRY